MPHAIMSWNDRVSLPLAAATYSGRGWAAAAGIGDLQPPACAHARAMQNAVAVTLAGDAARRPAGVPPTPR